MNKDSDARVEIRTLGERIIGNSRYTPYSPKSLSLHFIKEKSDFVKTKTMTDLKIKVEEALEQIRPYLQADGGNVSLLEITTDKVVKLELLGACKSCSMSAMTLKAGIEETIKRVAPEITAVEAINVSVTA